MSKIKITTKLAPKIKVTTKTAERIDPAELAAALGAEPTGERVNVSPSTPTGRAVRQEIYQRLRSEGGRPALEGSERRQKIPLSGSDWARLCAAAERFTDAQVKPTPGQVAAILVRQGLDTLEQAQ